MVAAVIHAALPCVCDRVEVTALAQQIEIVFFFFSHEDTSAHDFWPRKSFIPASPAEGLFQSECRFTVVCMYAPGISMVDTTSASSSMSMMWRWKSLLPSDCR